MGGHIDIRVSPDRRRSARLQASLPIRIIADGMVTAGARVLDLSAGGMSFSSDRSFGRGKQIRVRFRLPGKSGREVVGKVIRRAGRTTAIEFESPIAVFGEGPSFAEYRTSF